MKGFTMIAKTNSKESVQMFVDTLPYQAVYDTGNSDRQVRHYSVKVGPAKFEEIACVTHDFNKSMYYLYLKK